MIVNLSFNDEFVLNFLLSHQDEKLLDFAGVTQFVREIEIMSMLAKLIINKN